MFLPRIFQHFSTQCLQVTTESHSRCFRLNYIVNESYTEQSQFDLMLKHSLHNVVKSAAYES